MQQSAVIEYNHDGYQCEGFAVWDTAGPNRPGILVFPEWVGVGEYTQKRAQMLGELGFNAFVVDVYGKGIRPNTPSACEAEMMKYATNRPLLRQRARCGLDQLRKVPKTDLGRMAAIGYCFGGMTVLEMTRDGQNDLAGVVSFHGVLAAPTPLKPNTYKGKILVLHGVDDPVVPDDQTMAFWKEMRDAKANWEFVAYGKALHTFTNWLMPEDHRQFTTNRLIDALGSRCGISLRRFLHEISCRRCTSGRQRVLSPLQQRSAGVEDSRGPDALAIARVTITWWPPPTIKRIAAADCSDNFSTFAITLCPSSNDAI